MFGHSNHSATVCCEQLAKFTFKRINLVHINHLKFVGCGGNKADSVWQFVIEDSTFTGSGENSGRAALELVNTNAVVINTSFVYNGNGSYRGPIGLLQLYRLQAPTSELDVYAFVGGALIATESNVTIIDSHFEGNSAQIGGAIFVGKGSTMIVSNSSFINNQASYSHTPYIGGSIYCESSPYNSTNTINTTVFITNATFSNNLAYSQGGALVAFNNYLAVHNCSFVRNFAGALGGAIWAKNARVTIHESYFNQNTVHDLQSLGGGALALDQSIINITMSHFDSNSAWQGGVLYALSQTNVTIEDSQFRTNAARAHGGVISASIQCFVVILRSQIANNTAQRQGGAVAANYISRIMILDSTLQTNKAFGLGGVTSIIFHCQLFINNSQFYANTADIGGVAFSQYSTVFVNRSKFSSNIADSFGGVFHVENGCNISMVGDCFENNKALEGGVVTARANSIVTLVDSVVVNTTATDGGGAVNMVDHCNMLVERSQFSSCMASQFGGAITIRFLSGVHIENSTFDNDNAGIDGGGIFMGNYSFASVNKSQFIGCEAHRGGAIHIQKRSLLVLQESEFSSDSAKLGGGAVYASIDSEVRVMNVFFSNNSARYGGGVLQSDTGSNVTIKDSAFSENKARLGSTILALQSLFSITNSSFTQNFAYLGALYFVRCTVDFESVELSYNKGSVYMVSCLSHLMGTTSFTSSTLNLEQKSSIQQEGGALTLFQTAIYFYGTAVFENNYAESGGAIYATDSHIFVFVNVLIRNNTVSHYGGGIYLYRSDLRCESGTINFEQNKAVKKGGGIYAISSSIEVFFYREFQHLQQSLSFVQNLASAGGGLYLEANAKLYVWKYGSQLLSNDGYSIIAFANNSADFGGAIFVADSTNIGTCESNLYMVTKMKHTGAIECFIQILDVQLAIDSEYNMIDVDFEYNYANYSGSNLFGGLLDRCIASPFAEVHSTDSLTLANVINGVSYLRYIANNTIRLDSISSHPVRVCFCTEEEVPNCSYQPPRRKVMKGQMFTVTLVAIDQVNHTVSNATIHIYTSFSESGLGEGQLIQETGSQCTDVVFSITTIHDHEQLVLYAEGPCKDASMSQGLVRVDFLPCECPVGFQPTENGETNCVCECASELQPYVSDCDQQTEMVTKDSNSWISYFNHTENSSGYLIYLHCPFDYCSTSDHGITINLNEEDGADAQCAHNRAGILCGRCRPGFSLSLGSSHCISCLHWHVNLPIIILAAIVAGIILVASLLVLNLTVAIGTPNGIIFYANIVAANQSTFLPFSSPNFVTIFIGWLNLDFGFDTCFIEEMDSFWKFWVELCFPAYIIFLVVVVIIISEWSPRFAGLVGRKNPVATLATLILLSYAKLLRLIIAAFSFAILNYSDGSRELVWLLDGTVGYLSGKHIALFIAALLILLAGIVYTTILFFWQWILRFQNRMIFMWVRNQQLCHLLEPYHAPYIFQHRYWTGLFLLLRVILYTIAAVNVSNDPAINLLAIGGSVTGILIVKGYFKGSKIYKKWPVEVMEMISYLNITLFSLTCFYFLGSRHRQEAVAYLSVSVTFALFIVVLMYHIVSEFLLRSRLWRSWRQRCYLPIAHAGVAINDDSESNVGEAPDSLDSSNDHTALIAAPPTTIIDAPPRGEQPLSSLIAAGETAMTVTQL